MYELDLFCKQDGWHHGSALIKSSDIPSIFRQLQAGTEFLSFDSFKNVKVR